MADSGANGSNTRSSGDRSREQRLAAQRLQARQDFWDAGDDEQAGRRRSHRASRTRAVRTRRLR